jgi:GNAT superfamily N-acetyltransferase
MIGSGSSIRLAEECDLPGIGRFLPELGDELFPERFPDRTIEEFYHWKYFENPHGQAVTASAVEGERVVATVAAVPKRLWCRQESLTVYELGDFLTASDQRGKGLFSRLITMVCEETARRGASFVYVRPNDVSFPILSRHLSFTEPNRMHTRRLTFPSRVISRRTRIPARFLRPVDAFVLGKALSANVEGVSVQPINGFDNEADGLWERIRGNYEFALVRDSAYLNWRYSQCPTPYQLWEAKRNGQVAGFAVTYVSSRTGVAYVLDLVTASDDRQAALALASTSMRRLIAQGASAIYTWTLVDRASAMAPHASLSRACPFVEKEVLHLAVRFVNSQWSVDRLPNQAWNLMPGDFDGL